MLCFTFGLNRGGCRWQKLCSFSLPSSHSVSSNQTGYDQLTLIIVQIHPNSSIRLPRPLFFFHTFFSIFLAFPRQFMHSFSRLALSTRFWGAEWMAIMNLGQRVVESGPEGFQGMEACCRFLRGVELILIIIRFWAALLSRLSRAELWGKLWDSFWGLIHRAFPSSST
ncbi:uncharacterized protein EV422DRAFT_207319 [Fimicolochytrium jonesii]|uniref:uncharacterized protein n=1 Tax=Fimicolochytrium jonesii TaxID=1396493 RepID=UPI0022FF01D5|nr:uncharacterized protein EV422DRAFT_207319 [Fimicolochytrium jonesii]KAI8817832.1 hypothetical protein EV422DRAFT_207319 [Fimicolochytrium jonesii]